MEIIIGLLLGISLILNIILFIRGFALVKQIEQLSDIINEYDVIKDNTQQTLEAMLDEMKSIDLKGSFESDDEVGVVFDELKKLIETYKNEI
jgi:predicted PurR-regulated permease PerM